MEDGGYGGGSTAKHDKSNLKLISFFFWGDKFANYARSNAVTDLIHNIIITVFFFFFSLPIKREIILPNSRNGFQEIISVFFFYTRRCPSFTRLENCDSIKEREEEGWGEQTYTFDGLAR